MAEERVQRRLAAILAADVVGYSRLMGRDEAGTLAALKTRRKQVLAPLVARYQGRIFKWTGDGVLVEFGSAVNAVECAVALQRAMAATNEGLAADRGIVLRVGVNLGDVMVEGGDLYGDGVNIAARLEGIAEPGTVLVSGTAFDYVRNKIRVELEDLGTRSLKNIGEPVRVYRVSDTPRPSISNLKATTDKPSIAVLPFVNMSGDPEQQYFSDGITEDLITELSRFNELFVIARGSSFQFRDKPIETQRIGKELGVEYVVEGSVRKVGNRIRVSAQMVEAATGKHLWAERYDRELADIFAIQDELAQTIAATLVGRVVANGARKARRKPTSEWVAYDCFLQGRERVQQYDVEAAEPLLHRAIELDPEFAQAYAWQSITYLDRFFLTGRVDELEEAEQYARRALSLDDRDAWCHLAVGLTDTFMGRLEEAGSHFDQASALNPTDVQIAGIHAMWLSRMGRSREAFDYLDRAIQRDPSMPDWFWEARAIPLFHEQCYEEVIQTVNRIKQKQAWHHCYLAAAYAHLHRIDEARAQAVKVMRLKPDYSEQWVAIQEPHKDPAYLQSYLEGLRKAGLPE